MATNFVQDSGIQELANATGSTVSSGGVLVNRAVCGVAINDIANGASGPCYTEGIFTLAALSTDYWEPGTPLFWDQTNKRLTDTEGTKVLIGFADGGKALDAETANVKLHPSTEGAGTANPETTTTTA